LPLGSFSKLQKILPGGKTRQDSTFAGFQSIEGPYDVVLVHDGARPLIEVETIERCRWPLKTGSPRGLSLEDTVKEADSSGWVQKTDRRKFISPRLPKGHDEVLKEALEKAYEEGFQGTDEASLIERNGVRVKIVESDASNIKVTTALDFQVAEALLKQREAKK
jgi:2-C-methyl-D-erythritol 4-phosphate cytidylyltransferase